MVLSLGLATVLPSVFTAGLSAVPRALHLLRQRDLRDGAAGRRRGGHGARRHAARGRRVRLHAAPAAPVRRRRRARGSPSWSAPASSSSRIGDRHDGQARPVRGSGPRRPLIGGHRRSLDASSPLPRERRHERARGQSRRRTDRQVTQPSSFSNSVIGTVTTARPRERSSSAVCGASADISTVRVVDHDDGGAVLLGHREEPVERRRVVDLRRPADDGAVGQGRHLPTSGAASS